VSEGLQVQGTCYVIKEELQEHCDQDYVRINVHNNDSGSDLVFRKVEPD